MKEYAPWLWIAAIAVIFWLLIIRPASRRQKDAAALQSGLSVGDDVVLTSGVLGIIHGITDDYLEVSIAPDVVIHVVRGAIASVRRDPEGEMGPEDREDAEHADDATDAESAASEKSTPDDTEER